MYIFLVSLNVLNIVNKTVLTVSILLKSSIHVLGKTYADQRADGGWEAQRIIFTRQLNHQSIMIRGILRSINFADYKEDNRTRRVKTRTGVSRRVKRHHLCIPWLNRFCFRLNASWAFQ